MVLHCIHVNYKYLSNNCLIFAKVCKVGGWRTLQTTHKGSLWRGPFCWKKSRHSHNMQPTTGTPVEHSWKRTYLMTLASGPPGEPRTEAGIFLAGNLPRMPSVFWYPHLDSEAPSPKSLPSYWAKLDSSPWYTQMKDLRCLAQSSFDHCLRGSRYPATLVHIQFLASSSPLCMGFDWHPVAWCGGFSCGQPISQLSYHMINWFRVHRSDMQAVSWWLKLCPWSSWSTTAPVIRMSARYQLRFLGLINCVGVYQDQGKKVLLPMRYPLIKQANVIGFCMLTAHVVFIKWSKEDGEQQSKGWKSMVGRCNTLHSDVTYNVQYDAHSKDPWYMMTVATWTVVVTIMLVHYDASYKWDGFQQPGNWKSRGCKQHMMARTIMIFLIFIATDLFLGPDQHKSERTCIDIHAHDWVNNQGYFPCTVNQSNGRKVWHSAKMIIINSTFNRGLGPGRRWNAAKVALEIAIFGVNAFLTSLTHSTWKKTLLTGRKLGSGDLWEFVKQELVNGGGTTHVSKLQREMDHHLNQ